MSAESDAVDIWNSFYDKYGVEPKNSALLLKYVNNWQQDLHKINYKTARSIFNTYNGKGRLRDKLQNTATDIIEKLPTKKAKRDANTQNIVQLVSVFKLQLLVNGYIHDMNQSFLYIIPDIISHLCLSYCRLSSIIIVLHESKQMQIVDLVQEKVWKCKLNHLNNQKTHSNKHKSTKWSVSSGFCYAPSVDLPLQISRTYTQKTSDILFQSQQHYSHATLFDYSHVHYESDAPFDLYQYNLPLINAKRQFIGNSLCFDPNIGLVSIGGVTESGLRFASCIMLSHKCCALSINPVRAYTEIIALKLVKAGCKPSECNRFHNVSANWTLDLCLHPVISELNTEISH
eukprot:201780_1